MRKQVLTMAYDYLMSGGDVDLFSVIKHLQANSINPNQSEIDDISLTVDLINIELNMVRSLKLPWDTRRYNRLAYGI